MRNAPLFFRTFIVDSIETALGLMFAMNLVMPHSIAEANVQGIVIVSAGAAAVISAARRALPGFKTWLREQFSLPVNP